MAGGEDIGNSLYNKVSILQHGEGGAVCHEDRLVPGAEGEGDGAGAWVVKGHRKGVGGQESGGGEWSVEEGGRGVVGGGW